MPTIKCVKVSDNEYVGVTTLSEIRANCLNPMKVAKSSEKERAANNDLRRAYAARGEMQRAFNKPRVQRAVDYGHYIEAVAEGEDGGCPPITLWTASPGDFNAANASSADGLFVGELHLSGAAVLTASDGETQLAARYMLAEGFEDPAYARPHKGDPEWLDMPFAVTISVNSTKEKAMQVLHDMNVNATPVTEADTAPLNRTGPLTKAINNGIMASVLDPAFIRNRGKVTAKSVYNTNRLTLLHGAIGVAYGPDALASSTPNNWIIAGNKPFSNINAPQVAAFVSDLLALPATELRKYTPAHVLAQGVYFSRIGTLHPMTPDEAVAVINDLKAQTGLKSVQQRHGAKAIYDEMLARPIKSKKAA